MFRTYWNRNPWFPLRCYLFLFLFDIYLLNLSVECILLKAFSVWISIFLDFSCRLYARIRTWRLEKNFHPRTADITGYQWCCGKTRCEVSELQREKKFGFILPIRFRTVPTFGRDSIRRFVSNVSEMKKLGARDYENLLQVSTDLVTCLKDD